jgi:hypothetical protein
MKEASVSTLIETLRTEEHNTIGAISMLKARGSASVKPVAALLESGDLFERSTSVEILAGIDDPRVVGILLGVFSDPDSLVRKNAAEGVGKCGSQACVEPLCGLLEDTSRDVRMEASMALGRLKKAGASLPDGIEVIDVDNEKEAAWKLHKFDDIEGLVGGGLDVNTKAVGRCPVLCEAVQWGYDTGASDETVSLLLALGADPTLTDWSGNTPLHEAAKAGRPAVMKLLLKKGADPNARNREGKTPLFGVSKRDCVKLLVSSGCDVNLEDHWGNTALTEQWWDLDVLKSLLDAGANPNSPNRNGVSPLQRAVASAEKKPLAKWQSVIAALSGTEVRKTVGWKVTEHWNDWSFTAPEKMESRQKINKAKEALSKDRLGSESLPFGGYLVYSTKESAQTIRDLLREAGCPQTNLTQVEYDPKNNAWWDVT